jgi:hypothetical protein
VRPRFRAVDEKNGRKGKVELDGTRVRSEAVSELERTDGIDEKGRRIREGWASPRRVRFFANAITGTSSTPPPGEGEGETNTLQVKTRICARDLVPDELLYSDVVLRHKVDRVFLLADASRARRTLDRVRTFEYERSRFTREVGREPEDLLEFCRSERASHGLGGHGQNDGDWQGTSTQGRSGNQMRALSVPSLPHSVGWQSD